MIQITNEVNYKEGSITTLLINNQAFYLPDKKLIDLLNKLYYYRPDLFNDCSAAEGYKDKILELEAELDEALEELERKERD